MLKGRGGNEEERRVGDVRQTTRRWWQLSWEACWDQVLDVGSVMLYSVLCSVVCLQDVQSKLSSEKSGVKKSRTGVVRIYLCLGRCASCHRK